MKVNVVLELDPHKLSDVTSEKYIDNGIKKLLGDVCIVEEIEVIREPLRIPDFVRVRNKHLGNRVFYKDGIEKLVHEDEQSKSSWVIPSKQR